MCDTIAIVRPEGVLFAKNSDRDPNEAQLLEWHPHRTHAGGARVRCTWIDVPQVRETHAVLLSRPFWMWGAEMGVNEHGVAAGNEAVFTREPLQPSGLLGMDLLRLALERASTAALAVEVIVELLETHGQGGGCGHENRGFSYHNSFLVADAREAFVVETAGSHWESERIERGARTISNALSIPGFADRFGDCVRTRVASAEERQQRSDSLARESKDPAALFRLLRDHGPGRRWPHYAAPNGALGAPCVHAGGLVKASQTTASFVSDLGPDGARHWATATGSPCLSLFKPVRVDAPLTADADPTDRVDPDTIWWRHETFARAVLRDPERLAPDLAERDALEAAWLDERPTTEDAFAAHHEMLAHWSAALPPGVGDADDVRPWFVRRYWRKRDTRAGLRAG